MVKKPDYQKKNTYGRYNNNSRGEGGYQGKQYGGRERRTTYNSRPRYNTKVKVDETVDDIKQDILRIEKEIELELKEIKSLRLGM